MEMREIRNNLIALASTKEDDVFFRGCSRIHTKATFNEAAFAF